MTVWDSSTKPSALTLRWDRAGAPTPPALAHLRLTGAPISRISPSAILKRAVPCPDPNGDVDCLPDTSAFVLSHDGFILSGRIWTAFRTSAPYLSPEPLILKLHVPEPGAYGALEEAAIEGWVYEARLAGLDVVPAWRGMYGLRKGAGRADGTGKGKVAGAVRMVAAMLEDAGEPMDAEEVDELTPAERGTILTKYARLHAAGVVHGSPKPKHWLRPAGAPIGALRIIDFGAARILDGPDVPDELRREWCVLAQEEFAQCVLDEYRDLMRALGL